MNNLDFNCTENYTKEDIKKVQERLLEMALIVTKILDENDVKYMIAFGTLLGAVRDGGFISWDDDFDIFIIEDDYDSALKCLDGVLPNWIAIQNMETDETYPNSFTKLRDKNSSITIFNSYDTFKESGICIDLFKLTKQPKSNANTFALKECVNYYYRKYKRVKAFNFRVFIKNELPLIKKLVVSQIKSWFDNDNTTCFSFITQNEQKYFEYDYVFPLRKYQFCNYEFYGPNKYDKILRQQYNDYMSYPNYEERKPHLDLITFYD